MPPHDEIRNSFTVSFDYRILFTDGLFDSQNTTLADLPTPSIPNTPARCALFLDEDLHRANPKLLPAILSYFAAHEKHIHLAAPPHLTPGGENSKRELASYHDCVNVLHDAKIDRHSYSIAVGGGAMLDTVGFAASTVHRGLRQIRIPTTVLAQNDAGIGVKNGIDYRGKKNFLGSFYPPTAVINDFTLLRTLPHSHWRNGAAEAVKVALIRDANFFNWIEQNAAALASAEEAPMRHLIHRCAELHLTHIATAGDPFEHGSARPLDFGHWSAHKLEQLSDFKIPHGHAVAVGMAIDILYSASTGLLPEPQCTRALKCLTALGFTMNIAPQAHLSPTNLAPLLAGISEFQEHLGGRLSLTMLTQIGQGIQIEHLDMPKLKQCITQTLFQ